MKYQVQVKFTFTEKFSDTVNNDSETFEVEAESKDEAFRKGFEKVMGNWDSGAIAIKEISVA